MSAFDKAFAVVVGLEGVFSDDFNDPGNWSEGRVGQGELLGTKYGVSGAAYPHLPIADLTLEDAKRLYKTDYWDKIDGDSLPAAVALAVFDCGVNQGINRAIRLLQQALGVKDDGILGPKTLHAAQTSAAPALIEKFLAERALSYARLPTFALYGRGWMRRLFHICREAANGIQTQ